MATDWNTGQESFDKEQWDKDREEHRRLIEESIVRQWEQRETQAHYTPWLVIRYAAGDYGLRPIPTGIPFWHSPDIWVESSDSSGNGVAGELNYVHARVFNLGMAIAAPIKVDFYWGNPALGLGAANMHLFGTEWIDVRSQYSREVRCSTPWTPVYANNGHECLMVNCTNVILDPITTPFQPWLDRHVGQRNITVLHGQAGVSLVFRLELNNILPIASRTLIYARAEHIVMDQSFQKRLSGIERLNTLAAHGSPVANPHVMQASLQMGTPEYRNAQIAARLLEPPAKGRSESQTRLEIVDSPLHISGSISESRTQFLSAGANRALANTLMAREKLAFGHFAPHPKAFKFQEITMESNESRQLDLELSVPHNAKPGDNLVFRFEQWAEGMVLGGYTLVVQITEEHAQKVRVSQKTKKQGR